MYTFELYCDKWETHNSAINSDNNTIDKFPTVRVKTDNDHYQLGITLHKWKMKPSGQALAILTFGPPLNSEDVIWTNPNSSDNLETIQNSTFVLEQIKEQSVEQIIKDIEDGKSGLNNLHVYKYHASQWREIIKPKSKWIYKEKAEKQEICNVQRLLNS